jgi:phospholipase C
VKLTRRDALKGLGALAGTAATARLLSGCGGDGTASAPPTMVFLMMENRTYDHYLGARSMLEGKPGNGLLATMSNLDKDGVTIPVAPPPAINPATLCVPDPPHGWDQSRLQLGPTRACDGFAVAFQQAHPTLPGTVPMQYMTRADLPVYWALADHYTSCDSWYASLLGPTLPNRAYWMAATSNGTKSNDEILGGALNGVTSIFHRLNAANIDWAYYFGDVGVLSFVSGLDTTGRIHRFTDFLDAAAAGKLPPVVYIDPMFSYNDDHPPHYPLLGEQLLAATYQALATSPHWERSLLVITYDEHGGFFDHVAPPADAADQRAADGFNQLGFRVPSLVIGPHVKQGFVSSTRLEHTSALRHIENAFNLAPLTMRDAAANDLSSCLDPTSTSPSAPIQLPAVEVDASMLAGCTGTAFKGHDILEWAENVNLGQFDRRAQALDEVYAIGDYLDRHGLGRIVRR